MTSEKLEFHTEYPGTFIAPRSAVLLGKEKGGVSTQKESQDFEKDIIRDPLRISKPQAATQPAEQAQRQQPSSINNPGQVIRKVHEDEAHPRSR